MAYDDAMTLKSKIAQGVKMSTDSAFPTPKNLGIAVYSNNAEAIGNTPLIRINRSISSPATVLAKIESRNPAFSVKCRIGAALIADAEEKGLLKPGMHIVEPTSGNTGIALAFVAAAKGYAITLTMPASMSIERRKVLKAFGANLVLTEPAKGMKGAVDEAVRLATEQPELYYLPQQFETLPILKFMSRPLAQKFGKRQGVRLIF